MKFESRPLYFPTPIEIEARSLPRGAGDWPGYESVYGKLQMAAERMRDQKYWHLASEHIRLMAIIGCGHEETMKAELHRLRVVRPDFMVAA